MLNQGVYPKKTNAKNPAFVFVVILWKNFVTFIASSQLVPYLIDLRNFEQALNLNKMVILCLLQLLEHHLVSFCYFDKALFIDIDVLVASQILNDE